MPLGIFICWAEVTLENYPSTFQRKSRYLQMNKERIDLMILGSSHNQVAINPALLKDFNCSNLAFGGQDIRIDSALVSTFLEDLPSLKYIVFELSYHTLEQRTDEKYFRNTLYWRFYDINLFNRKPSVKDYSIFLSNPQLYMTYLNPYGVRTPVNEQGFATELATTDLDLQRFKNLDYNERLIVLDTLNEMIIRHKYEDTIAYNKSINSFTQMIDLALEEGVVPIIISTPVFENYYQSFIPAKNKRRMEFISSLINNNSGVYFLNFEKDRRFDVYDFKNEDHLNPTGAEKFSQILNDTLAALLSPQ